MPEAGGRKENKFYHSSQTWFSHKCPPCTWAHFSFISNLLNKKLSVEPGNTFILALPVIGTLLRKAF